MKLLLAIACLALLPGCTIGVTAGYEGWNAGVTFTGDPKPPKDHKEVYLPK